MKWDRSHGSSNHEICREHLQTITKDKFISAIRHYIYIYIYILDVWQDGWGRFQNSIKCSLLCKGFNFRTQGSHKQNHLSLIWRKQRDGMQHNWRLSLISMLFLLGGQTGQTEAKKGRRREEDWGGRRSEVKLIRRSDFTAADEANRKWILISVRH